MVERIFGKKFMKRSFAVLMAVAMCLGLVACTGEIKTDGVKTDSNTVLQELESQQQVQPTENEEYATAIHFKINPEFEVRLDGNNAVVSVEYLNDDAKNILSDIDVTGMDGLDAIDALLTAVFSSGKVKGDVSVYASVVYRTENGQASRLVKEIPALVLSVKDKTGFAYEISAELNDPKAGNTVAADSAESEQQETESQPETESQTLPQPQTVPYKQNVLYRADFDIPDVHGTGYTNLIDYYNAFPDGQDGGTFANAGLMVHYREDMDKDLSLADSLAFRTYRGIGLGSGKDEVFAAYGTGVVQAPFAEVMGIGDAQHTVSSFVEYQTRITSGACVGIRFYFDQNDTVMFIDYMAVYLQYAGNVSDASLYPLEG